MKNIFKSVLKIAVIVVFSPFIIMCLILGTTLLLKRILKCYTPEEVKAAIERLRQDLREREKAQEAAAVENGDVR